MITSSASFAAGKNLIYNFSLRYFYQVHPAKPTLFWVPSLLFLFKELVIHSLTDSHVNIGSLHSRFMHLEIFSSGGICRNQHRLATTVVLVCRVLSPLRYRGPVIMRHTWRDRSFQVHMQISRINLPFRNTESSLLQRKENEIATLIELPCKLIPILSGTYDILSYPSTVIMYLNQPVLTWEFLI